MLIMILNWYNQGNNLHKLGYGAPITMAIYIYTYNWNSTPKWRVYPIFSYSTSFFCKGSANHQLLRLEKGGRHMAMYGTLHCVGEMLKHHEFVSLQSSGFWKKLAAIRTVRHHLLGNLRMKSRIPWHCWAWTWCQNGPRKWCQLVSN